MSQANDEAESRQHKPTGSVARGLRFLGHATLDALMPPQCLGCGVSIERHGGLCGSCWVDLSFIAGSLCDICGAPFELAAGPDAICGVCARERPVFHRARSALRYDDAARRLILAFKRGDQTEVAPLLATWLERAGAELLDGADYLVPVPLHRWRLFQRRYNQAALLAHGLAKRWHLPVLTEGLVRKRATPSQGGLTREGRQRNVRNAFELGKSGVGKSGMGESDVSVISGRNLVLIDDVLTTGATVSACAKRLMQAGANRVDVLTVAMVMRGQSRAT